MFKHIDELYDWNMMFNW